MANVCYNIETCSSWFSYCIHGGSSLFWSNWLSQIFAHDGKWQLCCHCSSNNLQWSCGLKSSVWNTKHLDTKSGSFNCLLEANMRGYSARRCVVEYIAGIVWDYREACVAGIKWHILGWENSAAIYFETFSPLEKFILFFYTQSYDWLLEYWYWKCIKMCYWGFFQDKLALDQGLFTNNGGSRS